MFCKPSRKNPPRPAASPDPGRAPRTVAPARLIPALTTRPSPPQFAVYPEAIAAAFGPCTLAAFAINNVGRESENARIRARCDRHGVVCVRPHPPLPSVPTRARDGACRRRAALPGRRDLHQGADRGARDIGPRAAARARPDGRKSRLRQRLPDLGRSCLSQLQPLLRSSVHPAAAPLHRRRRRRGDRPGTDWSRSTRPRTVRRSAAVPRLGPLWSLCETVQAPSSCPLVLRDSCRLRSATEPPFSSVAASLRWSMAPT